MVLASLNLIDYVLLSIVLLMVIGAIIYLIINKRRGKNVDCGCCPLRDTCTKKKKK